MVIFVAIEIILFLFISNFVHWKLGLVASLCYFVEVYLSYEPSCPSVGWLVGLSVIISMLLSDHFLTP